MGKKWKLIKTFILNIFTEEVEVEIDVEDEQVANREKKQTSQKRSIQASRKIINTKDTRQDVPSRRKTLSTGGREKESFRFPVIPDAPKGMNKAREDVTNQSYVEQLAQDRGKAYEAQIQSHERHKTVNRARKTSSDFRNGSMSEKRTLAYEEELEKRLAAQADRRRARRIQRAKPVNRYLSDQERGYAAYEKEKSLKNVDAIPAYARRSRKMQMKEKDPEQAPIKEESSASIQEEAQTEEEPLIYSTPDELDYIFRKKDLERAREKEEAASTTNVIDKPNSEPTISTNIEANYEQPDTQSNEKETKTIQAEKNTETQNNRPSTGQLPVQTQTMSENTETHKRAKIMEDKPVKERLNPLLQEEEQVRTEKQEVPSTKVEETSEKEVQAIPHYLLDDPTNDSLDDGAWLEEQQFLLERTLTHFKIRAKVVHVTQGPTVTRFEIQPELGVKVSTIRNLADDLKLNLAAKEIRIEAPIPGKNTVGIEIPNAYPQMVTLQQMIESPDFQSAASHLSIALGLTIEGEPLITNIEKMPHGLIAGATGSGKSVCINTILLSLMYKAHYEDVKFLLIDPKMVELAPYNGIPHLVSPVITDVKAATAALKWAVQEMEKRYEQFVEAQVRHIDKFNEKVTTGQFTGDKMPYLVIVIDELADLMMVSPQDVEDSISRIAQKARACGIHLLLATQRPSVDVITGLIKANIPTRIAFTVSSQVDSRTILDSNGAEKLLGKGDMLFMENGSGRSLRLQGPFVSDEEIERVTSYMRQIAEPNYLFEQEQLLVQMNEEDNDELFEEVLLFVLEQNQASTSLLQRQFRIGYNRAARLIDALHHQGVISAQNGSKPREVLISYEQAEDLFFAK